MNWTLRQEISSPFFSKYKYYNRRILLHIKRDQIEPEKMLENRKEAEIHIRKLHEMLPELKEKYHVSYLGVFGSYVRGEQKPESDLDILVEFSRTPTIFKFVNLENYLSEALGVKVDLVMKDALKPNIGKHILNEVEAV
jgi:predicted nucleotidyltransferase